MNQLRLINIFYALPLLFFVLTGSQNLNGERIGQTMVTVMVLFLVVGYINFRNATSKFKRLIDFLATLIVLYTAYAGVNINGYFAILIIIWPIVYLFKLPGKIWYSFQQIARALLLFCLLYFGINQYGFDNLTNLRLTGMMLVFIFQFLFIATQFGWRKRFSMHRELGVSWLAAIVSLALYAWLSFDFYYALILIPLVLPAFVILFKLVSTEEQEVQFRQVVYFRILSIMGLTVFNFYLFIDVTQVLQAVLGGY